MPFYISGLHPLLRPAGLRDAAVTLSVPLVQTLLFEFLACTKSQLDRLRTNANVGLRTRTFNAMNFSATHLSTGNAIRRAYAIHVAVCSNCCFVSEWFVVARSRRRGLVKQSGIALELRCNLRVSRTVSEILLKISRDSELCLTSYWITNFNERDMTSRLLNYSC